MTLTDIRPKAEKLRELPTLEQRVLLDKSGKQLRAYCLEKQINPVWELKLVTSEARYWLCTQGLPEFPGPYKGADLVAGLMVGDVIPEFLNQKGKWEQDKPYAPKEALALQKYDYCRQLFERIAQLRQLQNSAFSWDRAKEIADLRQEFHEVSGIPPFPDVD
jgi:hypothetical protein